MRILLIDNYDSFTYNLWQLLAEVVGEPPVVAKNDEISLAATIEGDFDAVVISPGPGRPDRPADFGACEEIIRGTDLPLLGVCLGHEGIATAFGGEVTRVEPMHGRRDLIGHDGSDLFRGLPRRFEATRYHSLVVAEPLPSCLRVTARSGEGAVMALRHVERPLWGVQFHPESAGTPEGSRLIANFVEMAKRSRPSVQAAPPEMRSDAGPQRSEGPTQRCVVRSREGSPDPAAVFQALFGQDRFAFWLDREVARDVGGRRQTVMGSAAAPGSEVLSYDAAEGEVKVLAGDGEVVAVIPGSIFEVLRQRLDERRVLPPDDPGTAGGYVGYLGYELKEDLGSPGRHGRDLPDACLVHASSFVVMDHARNQVHAVRVIGTDDDPEAAGDEAERALARVAAATGSIAEPAPTPRSAGSAFDRSGYLDAVGEAQRYLREGESYELCLTNRFGVELGPEVDPLALYSRLRARSPAPDAAYLRLGEAALLGASPESFLEIGHDRIVRTSPIKGTRPRGADRESDRALRDELRASVKDQAENLMIVDVLRNDLGRVCEVGSVEVERMMEIESFAQVHQLVSTIRGRLASTADAVACVESCFPGGSMTGAPKLRSMAILDELESVARGPYAGAVGCFGLDGTLDLSIVIRSIAVAGGVARVGAGGAVTILSDPETEYEEMRLKARPLLEVLGAR
jgi:para-aminobenzoate synthetase